MEDDDLRVPRAPFNRHDYALIGFCVFLIGFLLFVLSALFIG